MKDVGKSHRQLTRAPQNRNVAELLIDQIFLELRPNDGYNGRLALDCSRSQIEQKTDRFRTNYAYVWSSEWLRVIE